MSAVIPMATSPTVFAIDSPFLLLPAFPAIRLDPPVTTLASAAATTFQPATRNDQVPAAKTLTAQHADW